MGIKNILFNVIASLIYDNLTETTLKSIINKAFEETILYFGKEKHVIVKKEDLQKIFTAEKMDVDGVLIYRNSDGIFDFDILVKRFLSLSSFSFPNEFENDKIIYVKEIIKFLCNRLEELLIKDKNFGNIILKKYQDLYQQKLSYDHKKLLEISQEALKSINGIKTIFCNFTDETRENFRQIKKNFTKFNNDINEEKNLRIKFSEARLKLIKSREKFNEISKHATMEDSIYYSGIVNDFQNIVDEFNTNTDILNKSGHDFSVLIEEYFIDSKSKIDENSIFKPFNILSMGLEDVYKRTFHIINRINSIIYEMIYLKDKFSVIDKFLAELFLNGIEIIKYSFKGISKAYSKNKNFLDPIKKNYSIFYPQISNIKRIFELSHFELEFEIILLDDLKILLKEKYEFNGNL